jgi:hypothetical protein
MPKYTEDWNECMKRKADFDGYYGKVDEKKKALLEKGFKGISGDRLYGYGVEIQVSSESYRLEMHTCPDDLANAIIDLLIAYKE